MAEIIRPRFGGKRTNGQQNDKQGVAVDVVRNFGAAAGYQVTLIHDASAPEGDVFKVLVGEVGSPVVNPVAITLATPVGENDAGMIAMAIMRTLELIEGD